MSPRAALTLLALLAASGIAVLGVQHDALRDLLGSPLGAAALVAVAGAWVVACVYLGVRAAVDLGLMQERDAAPIALQGPTRGARPAPERTPPPDVHPNWCHCPRLFTGGTGGLVLTKKCESTRRAS